MYKTLIEQQGFKLLEQIDNTLHTEIWKANQCELDRIVCLQILKPEAAQNALELEHFLLIARTFAKVKSETVASVFDIVSTSDLHYAVLEYVDGPTVGSLVVDGHTLSQTQILQIASSLALCFEQLWQKDRIIHRNLKGETVQIDPRGAAKLTDFSLAVTAAQDLGVLDAGHIVGTPSFIAPEYAQGSRSLTTQADMYSLGALLYQLATGHAPFSSMSPVDTLSAQIRGQIPPPHCLNSAISIEFSWFIHRLMMKNPINRYSDWHSVITDIHLLMQGELPTGIQTDERFLSTIEAKPLLDAMNGVDEEEEAVGEEEKGVPVRITRSQLKESQLERDHRRDSVRSNVSLAALMTLLMLAWFGGLLWYRGVWAPEMQRISEAEKKIKDVIIPPPTIVMTSKVQVVEQVVKPQKNDEPEVKVAVSEPKEVPQPATPETTEVPQPVAPVPMPEELKKSLVVAAKAGDLAAMRAAFDEVQSPFIGKNEHRFILEKASTANQLLEQTMNTKKDQTISFTWRGKSRIVVPRDVTETSVTLEANGRRQEIKFSDLTPDEIMSLVNKPQTEAEALSYCLLLMSTTQKSEVPLFASKCLPFQDILLQASKE